MTHEGRLLRLPLVVLAAGRSERLGAPKALRLVDGEPFLAWQLRRFAAAGGRRAVVVLGASAAALTAALPREVGLTIQTVINGAPERGPFSSLQDGVAALAAGIEELRGAFVLPVDVPAPSPLAWFALAAALIPGVAACVPMAAGRGGHPVLLGPALLAALGQIAVDDPDARLDRQLAALPPETLARVWVEDEEVTRNLNTEEEWRAWEATRDLFNSGS